MQNYAVMEFTAKIIAQYLGGTVEGDENVAVSSVSKIESGKKGTLSFLSNLKYTHYLYTTEASIVLVNKDFKPEKPVKPVLIRVDNAYDSLAKLLQLYQQSVAQPIGVEQPSFVAQGVELKEGIYLGAFAYIARGVQLGKNVKIYPQVYIGENVKIGDNVTLYSGVKIYKECVLGNNVTIHAGTIIGSDGFGFAPQADGTYYKIPQIGNVIIEDDVEIGANVTIDRSTMGSTVIHKGVKLDNLCHVAHNCEIGDNTVMAAQGGLAGSTIIGKNTMIGGQCGFAGHMKLPDNCKFGAKTGVSHQLNEARTYIGYPAVPQMQFFKTQIALKRLPEIIDKIDNLETEIFKLKQE